MKNVLRSAYPCKIKLYKIKENDRFCRSFFFCPSFLFTCKWGDEPGDGGRPQEINSDLSALSGAHLAYRFDGNTCFHRLTACKNTAIKDRVLTKSLIYNIELVCLNFSQDTGYRRFLRLSDSQLHSEESCRFWNVPAAFAPARWAFLLL